MSKQGYWTKDSYIKVEPELESLFESIDIMLSEHTQDWCLIKTSMIEDLDEVDDLKHRARLAETNYHAAIQKVSELADKYNISQEDLLWFKR